MITLIKKIKTKEGINTLDLEKIKKSVPAGYKLAGGEPAITYTANHIIVAYQCQQAMVADAKPKTKSKPKTKKAAVKVKA